MFTQSGLKQFHFFIVLFILWFFYYCSISILQAKFKFFLKKVLHISFHLLRMGLCQL